MPDIRYQIAVNREIDNDLTAEVAEIEVQQTIESPTTFRLRFAIDICGEDMSLLDDKRLNPGDPDTEITVIAVLAGDIHVLSHGIIVERQAKIVEGGPGSYLEIRGQDRRAVMDRKQCCGAAHSGTAADIVTPILERYGFRADVADTPIEYEEDSNTLNQTGSDLDFVDKVAGRSDVRFWIDWTASNGLTGFEIEETAHFKPSPPRPASGPFGIPLPQLLAPEDSPELRLNAGDGCSNVSSFEVTSNAEAPNQSGPVQRFAPDSGDLDDTEVPEPTSEPLGDEPAATQPRTRCVVSAGSAEEAQLRTQAALNDASFNVKATAETSVQALNSVLSAHRLVKVTGAGSINSGQYFLSSVTHAIDASDHKMRLEMIRNGTGAGA